MSWVESDSIKVALDEGCDHSEGAVVNTACRELNANKRRHAQFERFYSCRELPGLVHVVQGRTALPAPLSVIAAASCADK